MFTGIITDIGTVESIADRGDMRARIATAFDLDGIAIGASIACSGVCLTVVDKGPQWFAVDISSETLARTAAAHWTEGARINLERALRIGEELGGHFVTGHVDTVAAVAATEAVGGSTRLVLDVSRDFAPLIAPKGSITLDGTSLTVNEVHDQEEFCRFTVNIIPHTAEQTTLGSLAAGQQVNVEVDVLARYLRRMSAAGAQPNDAKAA